MMAGGPRLRGVLEHLERAQLLFDLANKENEFKTKYRLMVTAIYSCRAITELMLEAAQKQEVKHLKDPDPKVNRDVLEALSHRRSPTTTWWSAFGFMIFTALA